MNMHGHSNRNVIFICTTDQGYSDVNAGEHNHQRFGPVPEQFLYNPGEDILLSTEEEILRFYTENGRGVLIGYPMYNRRGATAQIGKRSYHISNALRDMN